MQRSLFFYAYALSAMVCSAIAGTVTAVFNHAVALAREAIDLFRPGPPRVAVEGWSGSFSITGRPLDRALQQSLRYESPAGFAATR